MNAAGIAMRPSGSNSPPREFRRVGLLEWQAIATAIQEAGQTGGRQADIACRFGRSEETVRRVARDPQRTRAGRKGKRLPSTLLAEERVRELHAAGLRGHQIDAACGWRRNRAGEIQQRLGLDPRRPKPSPAELRALYENLRTVRAVAEHIGCNEKIAARLLKDAGVAIERNGRSRSAHPLDVHQEALRQARADGVQIPDLAARYGVSAPTMRGYLMNRGIVIYRIVTAAEHDEIARLRAEGLSYAAIGRRMDRPGITIRKHLQPGPRPRLK